MHLVYNLVTTFALFALSFAPRTQAFVAPTPNDYQVPSPATVQVPAPIVPSPTLALTPSPSSVSSLSDPSPNFYNDDYYDPPYRPHPAPEVEAVTPAAINTENEVTAHLTTPVNTSPDEAFLDTHPAPSDPKYFFCENIVKCQDCSGQNLDQTDQAKVNNRWNDTHCDDVSSIYDLYCQKFFYDSGACDTTSTTTARVSRPVELVESQIAAGSEEEVDPSTEGDVSSAQMTAIIVCIVVAVVGGLTVAVFYVLKKKKEREYADFQV